MSPGATWNFGSCKNECTGMLVLHLLLLLSLWLIFKIWPAEVFSTGTTLKDVFQNWLKWFHFLFLEGGLFLILIDCMIFLSPFVDVTRMSMSTISFLAQVDSGILCLWNAFHWPMILEHVYMRPEVNSNQFEILNRFEMSFRLHDNLHGDFTAATF